MWQILFPKDKCQGIPIPYTPLQRDADTLPRTAGSVSPPLEPGRPLRLPQAIEDSRNELRDFRGWGLTCHVLPPRLGSLSLGAQPPGCEGGEMWGFWPKVSAEGPAHSQYQQQARAQSLRWSSQRVSCSDHEVRSELCPHGRLVTRTDFGMVCPSVIDSWNLQPAPRTGSLSQMIEPSFTPQLRPVPDALLALFSRLRSRSSRFYLQNTPRVHPLPITSLPHPQAFIISGDGGNSPRSPARGATLPSSTVRIPPGIFHIYLLIPSSSVWRQEAGTWLCPLLQPQEQNGARNWRACGECLLTR